MTTNDHPSAPDDLRAEAANPILAHALHYYAERRTMNNPKGWAHVLRVVNSQIERGNLRASLAHVDEARTILTGLVAHEDAAALRAEVSEQAVEAAAASIFWDRFGHGWDQATAAEREPEMEEARHALEAALPVLAADREGEVDELRLLRGARIIEALADKANRIGALKAELDEAREQLAVERGKVAAVRAVLGRLVSLKDGPRDDTYRAAKEQAWTNARAVLADPGQWEARVLARGRAEAFRHMAGELRGEDRDRANILADRADRVADGGES